MFPVSIVVPKASSIAAFNATPDDLWLAEGAKAEAEAKSRADKQNAETKAFIAAVDALLKQKNVEADK